MTAGLLGQHPELVHWQRVNTSMYASRFQWTLLIGIVIIVLKEMKKDK